MAYCFGKKAREWGSIEIDLKEGRGHYKMETKRGGVSKKMEPKIQVLIERRVSRRGLSI